MEFKNATCRGCYALGTACGKCEKCEIDKPILPPDVRALDAMIHDLRKMRDDYKIGETRSSYSAAIDRLDVLRSHLIEGEKSIKQLTKQQCINYWQATEEDAEEDTNYFIKRIKENGFYKDVPLDAQAAIKAWANCEPLKQNRDFLKSFAEIARLTLGIE